MLCIYVRLQVEVFGASFILQAKFNLVCFWERDTYATQSVHWSVRLDLELYI